MLTQSRLKELLHYDPETGVFTWRVRASNNIRVGGVAGCRTVHGYWLIGIDSSQYFAHRLAWLYMHGEWPKHEIDHKNGVGDDNRIANLREATVSENHQYLAKSARNTSGFVGVSWHSRRRKWQAQICIKGIRFCLGFFDSADTAYSEYIVAKARLHTFNKNVRRGGTFQTQIGE